MPLAEYMDLALYHPQFGYYARATRRSGRAGDFFTSVDVGPVFGELLAGQFAEMWRVMDRPRPFDLVEAGAGSGRLAADVLDAAASGDPEFYAAIRLHLVERSPAARAAQAETLRAHADRISSAADIPDRIRGVVFANELLDALPAHAVVMRPEGLREIFVDAFDDRLIEREGEPSTPALEEYLREDGVTLQPGWRAEINLSATAWVEGAARRLARGFLLLIDYGHQAAELYSATHASGTLATFQRHAADGGGRDTPWLEDPGERDITAHVDLTAIGRTAERAGLRTLGVLDQTYFLLGLGLAERVSDAAGESIGDLKRRLALKTLMLPGGLGSTLKVMIFGKDVGAPALRGCSYRVRLT